jgi:hypothetical protein
MARTDQRLGVGSSLLFWQGKCGCRHPKPQTSMQPSHSPVSLFMLWFQKTKSLNCSVWQIEQRSSHSNYQRRCHCRPKNGCWNGSSPPKIEIGRSSMLLTRCRGSSMVQELSCGSDGLWAPSQDHGRGPLVTVFYSFRNQQDVSRFEEEFLVDKNEVRDSKVCARVWHLSEGQSGSFETRWKPTTLEHSWVEMGEHLHGLHCGFTSHLARL